MSHTLIVLLHDRPGVLHRAVSLFRRRGYNIASLTVGHSERAGVSRMTVVVDARDVEQVVRQLCRLVEVLAVSDVSGVSAIVRETALVKISADAETHERLVAMGAGAGARMMDVAPSTVVFEMTDEPPAVERFIEAMRPYGIRELVRSGYLAVRCGEEADTAAGVEAPYHFQADGMSAPGSLED